MKLSQVKSAIKETIRTQFKESVLEGKGIPKFFLKMGAVKKEIDRLTAERKSKFGGEYAKKLNAETDPKKREQLKQPILAISQKITKLQANLADMYEKEEEYIQNLDKDTELDLAESINELKTLPNGSFKIKKKYNTFAEYEPHAKIGDTILKYSKKSPSFRELLQTGDLHPNAKRYLSKVHSIGTDGVNLTLFGKQTPASVHPSDKKELAVAVLESVNESLKHLIHVETPKEIVSKSVAAQIIALAKKGVRSSEIGLNMGFIGNNNAAVNAFQKVKNQIYFSLDKRNESVNESTFVKGKTYGGTKCEGGCFIGKTGLMKIIKISKESPNDVFMFRDDNYSGLQPHFIKNGVIAKATVINPAYDFEKHKVNNLKIGNDVILSVRIFV